MVTEGYLWTGQYPEAKRIIEKGNNHSMELDEQSLDGSWTYDDKSGMEFFIINDAIFSKLCILGDDVEPCFEGAQITKFSLDDEFNNKIYALMKEVKKLKGEDNTVEDIKKPEEEMIDPVEEVKDPVSEEETEEVEEDTPAGAPEDEPVEAEGEEDDPAQEAEPVEEPAAGDPQEEEESEEKADEDENKDEGVQFSLTDFQNLQENYANLESRFNELQTQYNEMKESYDSLVEFKNTKDREDKQNMIDSFYMLSDEEKKDVQDNIDQYSLDEIEAKLSVICVHNKLDLSGKANDENNPGTTFNLDSVDDDSEDDIPALVSVLRKNRKN